MTLWAQGQAKQTVRPEIGDGRVGVTVGGELVTMWRSEVADYLDAWFWSAFEVWWRWRVFGALPFAGGWAEQPAHLVVVIEEAETAFKGAQSGGRG